GRCTKIDHSAFKQEVPQGGFDPVGNLLALHTTDPTGTTERSFTYDYLSQLTEEKGPTPHTYTYDSLNDRLSQDANAYAVNSLHSVLSDSRFTYAYDPRGNRLSMQEGANHVRYEYDAL